MFLMQRLCTPKNIRDGWLLLIHSRLSFGVRSPVTRLLPLVSGVRRLCQSGDSH
jgi:hypothetical protein